MGKRRFPLWRAQRRHWTHQVVYNYNIIALSEYYSSVEKKYITFFLSVSVAGYLNVLVNLQWKSRWCLIQNRQLWIYNDKYKAKVAQQPVSLEGCMVLPDPSPEHLYSFRIHMAGEELATLEVSRNHFMFHVNMAHVHIFL